MKRLQSLLLSLFLLAAFSFDSLGEVVLPQVIGSNMIFQRNKEIKIWGTADRGEKVRVEFNGLKLSANPKRDGTWSVSFPAMGAGGPYTIAIKGNNSIGLSNIYIGDIWICSGQSNMEWVVRNVDNAEEEISTANYPEIRLLTVPKEVQLKPVYDILPADWKVCSPSTVGDFSAVAYFFGRKIYKETGIPIGLISTNWGGTVIEAWTSGDYLKKLDEFKEIIAYQEKLDTKKMLSEKQANFEKFLKDFNINITNPVKEDWSGEIVNEDLWKEMQIPGIWRDPILADVDGVIWFRREFNIPENKLSENTNLYLGPIDDGDITYINGTEVGRTESQYDLPRVYNVSPGILREGKNVISVRIRDFSGAGGFAGEPSILRIESDDYKIPLSGTWKYKPSGEDLRYNINPMSPNNTPSSLYNAMIAPLLNLSVKGVIWYQGESNDTRAYQYRYLHPLMIQNWRDKWNQPDMPFLFVQLANFMKPVSEPAESNWAELREAQLMTLSKLKNTGMAVTIDIGNANDIHPRNKQDVGYRLALNALKIAYGSNVVFSGPIYKSVDFQDGQAFLDFTSKGSGLKVKDKYGYLKGFSIAGSDKQFYWAKAKIDNGRVVVWSEEVDNPIAVRYAWANNPDDANLYNEENLPASPFRTDDWPGLTVNNR